MQARRQTADTRSSALPSRSGRESGREESWLCFESATQRRHLETYPAWWHALPPHELAALCSAAHPERPSPALLGVVPAPRLR